MAPGCSQLTYEFSKNLKNDLLYIMKQLGAEQFVYEDNKGHWFHYLITPNNFICRIKPAAKEVTFGFIYSNPNDNPLCMVNDDNEVFKIISGKNITAVALIPAAMTNSHNSQRRHVTQFWHPAYTQQERYNFESQGHFLLGQIGYLRYQPGTGHILHNGLNGPTGFRLTKY